MIAAIATTLTAAACNRYCFDFFGTVGYAVPLVKVNASVLSLFTAQNIVMPQKIHLNQQI